MSYDYRIPQGRDKGKRTNGMFSLGGKLGSVLSALGNGEKFMQVRLWQNWEMVMGPAGGKYAGEKQTMAGDSVPDQNRKTAGCMSASTSGGDEEGAENYVLLKKSDDEGRTWSEPILAVDPAGNVRAFDPCLWTAPDGRVFYSGRRATAVLTEGRGAGFPYAKRRMRRTRNGAGRFASVTV